VLHDQSDIIVMDNIFSVLRRETFETGETSRGGSQYELVDFFHMNEIDWKSQN
jgi:hypothetical protein